ncbi:MAG: hypothetical protein K0V04_28445 [Deltaproteobacteria bacterium]|nr:hypothetical protein [Deltaproteobacteria bacterium]
MNDAPVADVEFDADASNMLDAYIAEQQIPVAVHQRVWSRVQSDVVAPVPSAAGGWLRRGAMAGGLVAAALALWWMGGQVLTSADTREPANQAGYDVISPSQSGTAERRGGAQATAPEAKFRTTGSSRSAGPGVAPLERIVGHDTTAAEGSLPSDGVLPGAQLDPAAPEGVRADAPQPTEAEPMVNPDAAAGASEPDTAPTDHDSDSQARSSHRRSGRTHRGGSTRGGSTPHTNDPGVGSTLADENRLLGRARAALIDDQPRRALARLATHAKRYPEGVLAQERRALRAVALCEAGQRDKGAAAARAFLAAHPGAALAPRVRTTCLE